MASFPCIEGLAVAANFRSLFDRMMLYFEMETSIDFDFAAGQLMGQFIDRTNNRKLFINELDGLPPSVMSYNCCQFLQQVQENDFIKLLELRKMIDETYREVHKKFDFVSVMKNMYHVHTDDFMTPFPEGWSIWSNVWSIVLGEREQDSFLVIKLSGKVVQYNLISKTLHEIYNCGSNQLDDNDDDDDYDDDELLQQSQAEHNIYEFIPSFAISEVERDNEVTRILSCFKLNAFEYLNLPFDSTPEEVKRQYRKLSLLVHPDKCKHPQAKEAFGALAKAQQLLLDPQEREYLVNQINAAREELRAKRKKQLKKDTASKLKSLVDEGKYEQEYEKSEAYQQQLKLKVREILTDQEWRRRKMQMRISEEEGRLKKDEAETKEMWKRKREHEEQWEGTRENRVSSWRDFMKGGKKVKKGELRPPKLKTEDPNKSYVQRPVKKG
nr:hypothetical protein [Tanacetum cinerariifolium]